MSKTEEKMKDDDSEEESELESEGQWQILLAVSMINMPGFRGR